MIVALGPALMPLTNAPPKMSSVPSLPTNVSLSRPPDETARWPPLRTNALTAEPLADPGGAAAADAREGGDAGRKDELQPPFRTALSVSPPLKTISSAPLETVPPASAPPVYTPSLAPDKSVVNWARPPVTTMVPPLETVVDRVWPPEETSTKPPFWTVVLDAKPLLMTSRLTRVPTL